MWRHACHRPSQAAVWAALNYAATLTVLLLYDTVEDESDPFMQPKICHINLSRGYRGGERQMELLIHALHKRGWQQTAVVRRDEPLGHKLRGLPGLNIIEKSGNAALAAWFSDTSALVHVHQGRSIMVAGLHKLLQRTPYIVTRRVDNPVHNTAINRTLYRQAARVVAVSAAIKQVLRRLDPSLPCDVIPDALGTFDVDDNAAASIKARTGKAFLVGHIGELDDAHKGQLQLLEAATRLQHSHPDIGFMLVGSGRDEAKLRAAAAGLNNVFFAGQVERMGDYLAAFDLFAFPSRREGLGSSILDAYQFALPVIATHVGGIPEIVTDNVNGRLLAVDDSAAMTAAIQSYREDPLLCASVGATNVQAACAYTPDLIAAQYEQLYTTLIGACAA